MEKQQNSNIHQTSKSFLNEESASLIQNSLQSESSQLLDKSGNTFNSNQTTKILDNLNQINLNSSDSFIKNSKEQSQTKSQTDINSQKQTTQINSTTSIGIASKLDMNNQKLMHNFSQADIEQINKIQQTLKEIKPDKQSKIQLQTPKNDMLSYIRQRWGGRPFCTPQFKLTLNLIKPEQEIKFIQEVFKLTPSIIVSINGQVIQNKNAIHIKQGDKVYQGIQNDSMKITTIKQNENGSFQIQQIYSGSVKNKKQNGLGIYYFHPGKKQNSWQYEGEFVDGKRQGKGIERTSKNIIYQGQFLNDYKHGQGVERQLKKKKKIKQGEQPYIQKWKYQGKFFQGSREDEKAQYICKYYTYEGPFKDNVKHGHGCIKYKNGDKYQGDFQNDLFSGKGVYTYSNGASYQGQFKQGHFDGQGVQIQANGNRYEGQFKQGKKHGQGMYSWPDGDYYDGGWQNGLRQGTGAQTNGSIFFDGEFHHGDRHGVGQETDADGNTIKALWQHNIIKKKIQVNGQPVDD